MTINKKEASALDLIIQSLLLARKEKRITKKTAKEMSRVLTSICRDVAKMNKPDGFGIDYLHSMKYTWVERTGDYDTFR